jgi:hypothetical protein
MLLIAKRLAPRRRIDEQIARACSPRVNDPFGLGDQRCLVMEQRPTLATRIDAHATDSSCASDTVVGAS